MATVIVRTKNLTRSFGTNQALAGVDLSIRSGSIFGLLGPNGAGKTTLVRILATLLVPSGGTASVDGFDVVGQANEVRRRIGLAGQSAAVDGFLTGRETLLMVGRLYHLPTQEVKKRTDELLARLDLIAAADRPAKTYSGGMRRRLDIGASLIGRPKVIFLDEPTAGLDPRTRADVWEIIRELVADGSTILLTTQYLDEADALADTIAVIDHGQLVAEGTPRELKSRLGRDIVEVTVAPNEAATTAQKIERALGVTPTTDQTTGRVRLPATGSQTLLAVARALEKAKTNVSEIVLHRPTLDDVFLAVTGGKGKK